MLYFCAVENNSLGNLEVTWCIAAGAAAAFYCYSAVVDPLIRYCNAAGVAAVTVAKFYMLELRLCPYDLWHRITDALKIYL